MAQDRSEKNDTPPTWVAMLLAELDDSAKLPDVARGVWRWSAMSALARWMRQMGADAATILTAAAIENRKRCIPPLTDADLWLIVGDVVAGRVA